MSHNLIAKGAVGFEAPSNFTAGRLRAALLFLVLW